MANCWIICKSGHLVLILLILDISTFVTPCADFMCSLILLAVWPHSGQMYLMSRDLLRYSSFYTDLIPSWTFSVCTFRSVGLWKIFPHCKQKFNSAYNVNYYFCFPTSRHCLSFPFLWTLRIWSSRFFILWLQSVQIVLWFRWTHL